MAGLGMHGFVGNQAFKFADVRKELATTDQRIFAIAEAFMQGMTVDEIHDLSKIDRWFLEKLKNIDDLKNELQEINSLAELSDDLLVRAKQSGFSDFQIARLVLKTPKSQMEDGIYKVRTHRKQECASGSKADRYSGW